MTALLLVKASVLLSITLLAVFLSRRAPAASRHRLWTLAFTALLALPLLSVALPALRLPAPPGWIASASRPAVTAASASHLAGAPSGAEAGRVPVRGERRVDAAGGALSSRGVSKEAAAIASWPSRAATDRTSTLLAVVWLVGATLAVGTLAASLLRVRRLARSADAVTDPAWRDAAAGFGARLGLRRSVRLLASVDVGTPMAAGILRPTIFLPAAASSWSAEHRDVVLAHEIAHLAARDPLRHLTARLALSCYWFHPLAWIAARQGMLAREQACDEAVLALGTRPSTYARVLLDLAGSLRSRAVTHGALPMVERSLLETRLMAILNDSQPAIARRAALPLVAMALVTCTVAAARPGSPTTTNVGVRVVEASPTTAPSNPATPTTVVSSELRGALAPLVALGGWVQRGADPACGSNRWGSYNGDRVIQQTFGDLQVCMVAEGIRDDDDWKLRPSQWPGSARRVVLESRRGGSVQRLEVRRGADAQISWQVGGAARSFDAAAQEWRDRTLAALDTTWEISVLRGQVSSLRGEISSIRGEESSMRGEISSLRGEVSSMQGQASSVRGDESSLRGQISSIQGHVSSLRGQISSERGQISSLQAAASIDDPVIRERVAARVAKHNEEIVRIEREIRDYGEAARIAGVEKQIAALGAAGKVAAIEEQIRAFDLQSRIAAVERRIVELDVPGKVGAIERRIEALDADRRVRQLEERRDGEVRQIERALAALR